MRLAKKLDQSKSRNAVAFTLVELLVVISIIGILMSISVVGWISVSQRGRDSSRKADLARLKQVLLQQYGDTRTYPTFETNAAGPIYLASWQLTGTIVGCPHIDSERLPKKYLDKIPVDPNDNSSRYQSDSCDSLTKKQSTGYLYLTGPTSDGAPISPSTNFALMATLEQNAAERVSDSLNPLKTGSTVFGPWYAKFANYADPIKVTANYLVDGAAH